MPRRAGPLDRLAVYLLAVMLVVGCASWMDRPASEEERRAWAQTVRSAEAAPDGGREALEAFLSRHPDGPLAAEATLELASLDRRAGNDGQARRRYQHLVGQGGAVSDRARVQLATLELENDDTEAARRWLEGVRPSRLEGGDLRNAYRALAESTEAPPQQLRWLTLLRKEVPDPAEVAAIDLQIDALIAELDPDELNRALRLVGNQPPAGRLQLARAERALDAGNLDTARDAVEAAGREPLPPRYAQQLADVLTRLEQRSAGPTDVAQLPSFETVMDRPEVDTGTVNGTLGVVLPLSGPYARFGERALQGVLLAADVLSDPESPGARVKVRVFDSAGDAEQAAAAVRRLAEDDEVTAIVGPLVARACEAAAVAAEEEEIPLLALSSRDQLASERSWVFRLRTRPLEEAQLLADRAIALGDQRFAILYRDDPYGRGLRALFWDAVEARGGEVVGVASYDPKATDFGASIRRLVGYTLLDSEERRLLAKRDRMLERARRLPDDEARKLRREARNLVTGDGRPIPPVVDFDALFIPESHDNVVLIAPQLAFHEVAGVRLLGTDGWYHPDLVRIGGKHVEGAIFSSHFFPQSPVPAVAEFSDGFEKRFATRPDAFSATSYDAARLVMVQWARGYDGREKVRSGLLGTEAHVGATGVLTLRSDGNAHKRPFLLGVERGQVVQYLD